MVNLKLTWKQPYGTLQLMPLLEQCLHVSTKQVQRHREMVASFHSSCKRVRLIIHDSPPELINSPENGRVVRSWPSSNKPRCHLQRICGSFLSTVWVENCGRWQHFWKKELQGCKCALDTWPIESPPFHSEVASYEEAGTPQIVCNNSSLRPTSEGFDLMVSFCMQPKLANTKAPYHRPSHLNDPECCKKKNKALQFIIIMPHSILQKPTIILMPREEEPISFRDLYDSRLEMVH